MKIILLLFALLLANTCSHSQSHPFQKKFPSIDKYIDSLMKDWNIPGLSLGIVYKDQLIYSKGYGYRDLEKKLPVEPATIFAIASNTKLFTATAAAMLAEEGKLDLDKPAKIYMPSLNFYNEELNAKVALRDMLSHRVGLPTYNAIWVASPFTRKEAVQKVAYMQPQLPLREGYIYNNMMYVAAGAVMEAVTGMTWEELVRKRFFQPLQMNSSFFSNEEMMKSGNYAVAYFEPDSSRRLEKVVYFGGTEALGPAGTIKSNVPDMSHWMIAQLNRGNYAGKQVIPETVIRKTLVPNSISDRSAGWDELSHGLYGLGRIVQMYKGYKITMHTGSIDGHYSNLTFIPSENIGIFMVHNSVPAGSIRSVMALPIIDRLLDLSLTPWSERYMKDYLKAKAENKRARDSINATQVKATVPSHPLKDFTGKYASPIYGEMNIGLENGQLMLSFRDHKATILHHFHYDQFVTKEETRGRTDFRLNFLTNSKGTIDRISVRVYGDPPAEFVRKQ